MFLGESNHDYIIKDVGLVEDMYNPFVLIKWFNKVPKKGACCHPSFIILLVTNYLQTKFYVIAK